MAMTNRPLGVTLVAIIAWVSGLFQIIASIVVIFAGLFITWPAIVGWFSLVVGIVTLLVGVGLWRGNPTARTIAAIVFTVTIILEVISIFAGDNVWSAIGGMILPAIGLILLYTRSAREYFGS
jgi:phage-related minor tail protein